MLPIHQGPFSNRNKWRFVLLVVSDLVNLEFDDNGKGLLNDRSRQKEKNRSLRSFN